MNRSTILLLSLPVLTACGGAAPPPPPLSAEPEPPRAVEAVPEGIVEPDPIPAGRARTGDGPYAPGVNVQHYDVELAFNRGGTDIWGRASIRFMRAADLDAPVRFDLTGLAVIEVLLDGAPTDFRLRDGQLTLEPTPTPGPHEVEIRYRGTPDDGLILRENVHGAPTVFADNWPNRARFWFPSVDHPSDKATVRFTVHAPLPWQVIANGALEGAPEPTDIGTLTALGHPGDREHHSWVWSTNVEIPSYTMVVGAADFHIGTTGLAACGRAPASRRSDGCVEVTYWVFPPDSARAREVFARSDQMIDFYTELVGPYPYEKLANVQSATRFGGMENATAIFYSEQAIASGRLGEGTVAHEIAHQWFGDSVTEREWSHLWLSEGFATYFGALFFEEVDGVERFREIMEGSRQRIVSSQVVQSRPVLDRDDNLFALLNDNNYPKGGWVLHMLRGVLGDDTFFEGIATYYERYRNGTALTADLRSVMEEVSGVELDWFFDQWLGNPGYPVFETDWSWDGAAGELELTVRQTQDAAWGEYRVPMTVEVQQGSNRTRHDVEVDGRAVTLRLPVAGSPSAVVLDPDGWVLGVMR